MSRFCTFLIVLLICLSPVLLQSQSGIYEDEINWKGLIHEQPQVGVQLDYLDFEDAITDLSTGLPIFQYPLSHNNSNFEVEAVFTEAVFKTCSPDEVLFLSNQDFNQTEIEIKIEKFTVRKKANSLLSFIPLRKNPETSTFEKMVSFKIEINSKTTSSSNDISDTIVYAENSVLSSGYWVRLGVEKSGIHKITYDDLLAYGLNPDAIDPKNIRIFGNGGGMLPEKNSDPRYDDLQENAIFVSGENDGVFNEDDYVLFFGDGPNKWDYVELGYFKHIVNLYSDQAFYFLTTTNGTGLRIEEQESSSVTPTHFVNTYNYYDAYEEENINLVRSGKEWYSIAFSDVLQQQFTFEIPNINITQPVEIKTSWANRSFDNDMGVIGINGTQSDTISLIAVTPGMTTYARTKKKTVQYNPVNSTINVDIELIPSTSSSVAWLDYIRLNAVSFLRYGGNQILFRDNSSFGEGNVARFSIAESNENVNIWEVTNPLFPKKLNAELNADSSSFVLTTDTLKQFIAFEHGSAFSPTFIERVNNQNLHALSPTDYIIITHPDFLPEAERLAQMHRDYSDLTVEVITNQLVYNEFSSGAQDPTAIRDLMRMLYNKYPGQEPQFLLLFGDGSYDPKNRLEENTNFVPTFQTAESWNTASSYVIDDYFGLLDENEGNDASGVLDIGIGRFPVQTLEEATSFVNKVEKYMLSTDETFGVWRNKICFIADDEDGNLHQEQADTLSAMVTRSHPIYNQHKIYLDAYEQVQTPSGKRYPEVNEAINKQMEEGALIMNYVGHGGELGWASENILSVGDIKNWSNPDMLPAFMTATCEFSRFDNPAETSAGEYVFLNEEGGGISLFTTTRLAYANANFALNKRFYEYVFQQNEGEYYHMGDLIRLAKPPTALTTRNFVLLGDPALKIAYPKYNIATTKINGQDFDSFTDTLSALSHVSIEGIVIDASGSLLESFNGTIFPRVFDKETRYKTLANDPASQQVEFFCQDKVVYHGRAGVINGRFSFEFVIPKDISLNFGNGKISYYASSENEDAHGYYNGFSLGGYNTHANEDNQGPLINLFLNNEEFISGDQTDSSPLLIAYLEDEHGLNLSQNGIGHGIVATLDNNTQSALVLNDFYEPQIDDFKKGKINFPYQDIEDGWHTLSLKAWDSYNNSSEATIDFIISTNAKISINQLINWPNPFNESTIFSFKHTKPGQELKIELEIFDLSGKKVLSYNDQILAENIFTSFLSWDGTDSSGNKLQSGMYVYILRIKDQLGNLSTQNQKLIILR
jgi:hypothetical protein